ncbi:MAG: hypothetical protein GY851_35245 [bacterium]|nr:hypothetical protein [bacterium]
MTEVRRLEFPLLSRELTRAGKRTLPYFLRMGCVAFVYGYLALTGIFDGYSSSGNLSPSMASFTLQWLPRVFQFVVVFGLAPFLAAGLIAEEKRSRTFELLLLADLRGGDLYFAKLASVFGQVMMLLLSALPILAIGSIMGGIWVPAEALRLLVLSACGLAICTVALLFSTASRTPLDALLGTLGSVTLAVLGPMPFSRSRPTLFKFIWSIDSGNMQASLWLPILLGALGIACICAIVTVAILPRSLGSGGRKRPLTKRRRRPTRRRFFRPNEATRLAEAMLAGGRMSGAGLVWRAIVAIALVPIGMMSFMYGIGVAMLAAITAFEVTSAMAAARNDGTLDELLVTPIESPALAKAIIHAFRRRTAFLYPAIAAPYLFLLVMWGSALYYGEFDGEPALLGLVAVLPPVCVLFPRLMLWCFCTAGCTASTFRMRPAAQAAVVGAMAMVGQIVLAFLGFSVGFLDNLLFLAILAFSVYGGAHFCAGFAFRASFEFTVNSTWRSDRWEDEAYADSAARQANVESVGAEEER